MWPFAEPGLQILRANCITEILEKLTQEVVLNKEYLEADTWKCIHRGILCGYISWYRFSAELNFAFKAAWIGIFSSSL